MKRSRSNAGAQEEWPGRDGQQIMTCRLSVPLPKTGNVPLQYVSGKHPELQFRLLSFLITEDHRIIEDVDVLGQDWNWKELLGDLSVYPGVISVQKLHESSGGVLFRLVTQTSDPLQAGLRSVEDLGIGIRLPFTISNGELQFLLVADNQKLQRLFRKARRIVPGTQVRAIYPSADPGPDRLLTPRQAQVFRVAMSAGYWDIPRRANLGEIAQRFRVSKSTISETLAHIENKLLHELAEGQAEAL